MLATFKCAPFGGVADACKVTDSRVAMPDVPGIGFEAKNDLYAVMKQISGGGDGPVMSFPLRRKKPADA